eukprot:scaffold21033_cov71-Skeletonema_dohrnii-CCMP3373.AAC.2
MISYLSGCWLLFAYPAPASPFSLHLPDRPHCTAGASRASSQQLQLYSVPPTSFGSLLLQTDNGNGNAFLEEVVTTNNKNTTPKFRCNICSRGFDKQKQYKEHLVGKKHNAIMDQADDAWREYQNSGPVFFDETVAREVVIAVWSLDLFVDGLQARSRSSIKSVLTNGINLGQIDPNIRVEDLSPNKRAMIWRHLHTSNTADMVNLLPPQYARVKEILESLEVFRHIEKLLRRRGNTTYGNIYDVGCGHGLVGMLCAAAYPHIRVQCIDRVPRESFQAQRTAFEASGMSLDNLHFVTGDLTVLEKNVLHAQNNNNSGIKDSSGSLLLCVHGCKSLTHESIELACSNN